MNPKNIGGDDISVVIQGPLYQAAEEGLTRCLGSLRCRMPTAEIIVATWESEIDANKYRDDVDKILFLKDPGSDFVSNGRPYNFSRMLFSTRSGIDQCSRKYILKFRADCAISSDDFFIDYGSENEDEGVINVTNYFLPNPEAIPLLYHLPDTVQFGRRRDMKQMWGNDFDIKKFIFPTFGAPNKHSWGVTMLPEQALAIGWINSMGIKCNLSSPLFVSEKDFNIWVDVMKNKLKIIHVDESGIVFPEDFHCHKENQISKNDVLRLEKNGLNFDLCMRAYQSLP